MRVTEDHMEPGSSVAGVRGSGNVDQIVLAFDGSWDGFSKTCVWWDAHGVPAARRLLTAELLVDGANDARSYMVPVPPEALRYAGECSLVIEGAAPGRRARSAAQSLRVVEAPLGEEAGELTPSEVEQLQAQVDALLPKLQEVLNAETGRREAEARREEAVQTAVQAAQAAAQHPPQVGAEGRWMVWDSQAGAYRDTELEARGPQGIPGPAGSQGPRGETGPKGEDGILLELGAGVFAMSVSPEGHLLVSVNAEEAAPPLEIDRNGHLIYKITT